MNKFDAPMPAWSGNFGKRLQDSVALLYINGYLTGSEKGRVRARLEKAWLKAEANQIEGGSSE